jgi:hypothetical protein
VTPARDIPNDPDVIVRLPEGWPEPGPFIGQESFMRQLQQQRGTWDADAVEPTGDLIDVGNRVVVRFIWLCVGRGPDSRMEFTAIYTVRKGKISSGSPSGITRKPSKR